MLNPNFAIGDDISIKQGRHPVVEQVMKDPFIANPVELNAQRKMLIITGPNMGGNHHMRQQHHWFMVHIVALC